MNDKTKILIAAHGLGDSLSSTLTMLLDNTGDGRFISTEAGDESICIFDVKSDTYRASFENYKEQYPDRAVIVVHGDGLEIDNAIRLKVPLTPKNLFCALNEAVANVDNASPQQYKNSDLEEKLNPVKKPELNLQNKTEKFVSSRENIDLTDPAAVDSIRYSIEPFLVKKLLSALSKGREIQSVVRFKITQGAFTYYPDKHVFHVDIKDQSLRSLSVMPDNSDITLTEIAHDQVPAVISKKQLICADTLLWNSALWSALGRLPSETDLDQTFTLKHWPNFTRLTMTPHAMQLTALWVNNRLSLRKTIALTSIPQRYVFSLYSTALVCGLIQFDEKNVDLKGVSRKKERRSGMKKLLEKILDYVKLSNGGEA